MFYVIQEVEIKKIPAGEAKEIKVYETTWTIDGMSGSTWEWSYSDERFDRPVRRTYRISIHEGYREAGKVRKKQTVICIIGYYEIVDWGGWIGDYIIGGLKRKADALGLSEEVLSDMVYKRLQPIIDRVEAGLQQTKEYKVREEHRCILEEHNQKVEVFKEKYDTSESEYKRCYDAFGNLRSPEAPRKVKADYKTKRDYERRSQKESRSYYNNYDNGAGGSHGSVSHTNREDNKAMLKKFYRTLSKAYHPDSNPGRDTSEEMKLLNQLKNDWGA